MNTLLSLPLPIFMPDATLGTVRTLTTSQIESTNTKMLVVNTYHLFLSHGVEQMKKLGGIKKLMNWNGRVLSDSGGFQVYSLIHKKKNMGKITQYGAYFKSPKDGSQHLLTPEISIEMQVALGSDVMIALDDCRHSEISRNSAADAVRNTTNWAKRAIPPTYSADGTSSVGSAKIFAVVQGGSFKDLRRQSAEELQEIGFDGYCFGGWPVDGEGNLTEDILGYVAELLPDDKPKYAMGVGTPDDIRKCYKLGYNMFDCVIPTRNARHGLLYTSEGELRISKSKYLLDESQVDPECTCETCTNYSRAYLCHLFRSGESTAGTLATIHNLRFYQDLMAELRG